MEIQVRRYRKSDAETLALLFFDSVRNGTSDYYNAKQRQAWATQVPETVCWAYRFEHVTTFIAQTSDRTIGFMTLDNTGYIDLAFVSPNYIRRGVGSMLYQHLHREAVLQTTSRLHTQASEMAKPFFEKQGWSLVKTQKITREHTILVNHVMEKYIAF